MFPRIRPLVLCVYLVSGPDTDDTLRCTALLAGKTVNTLQIKRY